MVLQAQLVYTEPVKDASWQSKKLLALGFNVPRQLSKGLTGNEGTLVQNDVVT